MTDAPERIWRDKPTTRRGYNDGLASWPRQKDSHEGTEYIRADVSGVYDLDDPINPAPKQGQWVILLGIYHGEPVAVAAFWGDDEGGWYTSEAASSKVTDLWTPTHWMHLPGGVMRNKDKA